jgi:hypothetical protein
MNNIFFSLEYRSSAYNLCVSPERKAILSRCCVRASPGVATNRQQDPSSYCYCSRDHLPSAVPRTASLLTAARSIPRLQHKMYSQLISIHKLRWLTVYVKTSWHTPLPKWHCVYIILSCMYYTLDRKRGGPQGQFGCCLEEKNYLVPAGDQKPIPRSFT